MLYLSEARNLLYVTDTNRDFRPSHNFEHLSCFLPGLLAVGADQLELSLDDLDYATLGPVGQRSYDILRNYDLRALHRWAAEGLATTCWLLYDEQPSGLGPDVVHFQPKTGEWPTRGTPEGHSGKLWIDGMEKWRKSGARGYPPGLGEKKPVRLTRDEIGSAKLRALRVPERDYVLSRSEYFLRPEVWMSALGDVRMANWRNRQSSRSISCGGRRGIPSGGNAGGPFSRRSSERRRRRRGTRRRRTSYYRRHCSTMTCRGARCP